MDKTHDLIYFLFWVIYRKVEAQSVLYLFSKCSEVKMLKKILNKNTKVQILKNATELL